MPSRKVLRRTPKVKKWVPKKGWVIKQVKNPVVCCYLSAYPPIKCKTCGFYPVYADAYGTYRCPRCSGTSSVSTGARPKLLPAAATGTVRTCPFCRYYPCYPNALTGTYHCPHCHKDF
jgi:hypothetical protein